MLQLIIDNKVEDLVEVYNQYIREAKSPTDIKRWAQKKTITKAVTNCDVDEESRKNESDVWDAIKDKPFQEGDKVYVYPAILSSETETKTLKNGKVKVKVTETTGLRLVEDWKSDHSVSKLVQRVVKTVAILSNVVDKTLFLDYTKVVNKEALDKI